MLTHAKQHRQALPRTTGMVKSEAQPPRLAATVCAICAMHTSRERETRKREKEGQERKEKKKRDEREEDKHVL